MIKVEIVSRGSLFHYAHFICDCLFLEINSKTFMNKEVIRPKTLTQSIGNFQKVYEEVMGIRNRELVIGDYNKLDCPKLNLQRNRRTTLAEFNNFRNYIFERYKIKRDETYPEIILIERGDRIELLSDPELRKKNKNVTTGKERREIDKISEIKRGNMTKKDIAEFLNHINILKRGKKWSSFMISNILQKSN